MHQLGSDYLYLYMVLTNPDRKILYYEQAVRIEFAMAQNDAKKADKSGSSLIRLWRRINPGRLVVDTIILPPEALRTVRLLSCVHKDSCQFPWFQVRLLNLRGSYARMCANIMASLRIMGSGHPPFHPVALL